MNLLSIIIPTWNRKPLLEVCIDSIASQVKGLPVSLLVSDHGSTDGTFAFLKEKERQYPFMELFVCRRLDPPDFSHNFKFAFDLPSTPFTWTFGDDDKMLPGALEKVVSILDERVPFVHVGEVSRTKNTMQVLEGSMIENCNKIGLLDFTGFITGNIIRTDKLKAAVNSPNWDGYATTAFPQSLSLLESLFYDNTAFIDFGLIEAQDRELSGPLRTEDDRGMRWFTQNIGARYSYIIPQIRIVLDTVGHKEALKLPFFRYLSYYLWDRFIQDTISTYSGMVMNAPHDVFIHEPLWELFAGMADYLSKEDGEAVRKSIMQGKDVLDFHQNAIHELNKAGRMLDDFVNAHSKHLFPYLYLGEVGEH